MAVFCAFGATVRGIAQGTISMADAPKLTFGPIATPASGVLVVFADGELRLGARTRAALGAAAELVARVAKAEKFTGKSGSALDIVAPAGLTVSRLIVIGTGKASGLKTGDFLKFGGVAASKLQPGNGAMAIMAELAEGAMTAEQAAAIATGLRLRTYKFDRYKTKKKDGEEGVLRADISLAVADVAGAKAFRAAARSSTAIDTSARSAPFSPSFFLVL